jgi:hypothetical protein
MAKHCLNPMQVTSPYGPTDCVRGCAYWFIIVPLLNEGSLLGLRLRAPNETGSGVFGGVWVCTSKGLLPTNSVEKCGSLSLLQDACGTSGGVARQWADCPPRGHPHS